MFVLSRVSQLTVKTFGGPKIGRRKTEASEAFPKVPKGITGLFARLERRQGPPTMRPRFRGQRGRGGPKRPK